VSEIGNGSKTSGISVAVKEDYRRSFCFSSLGSLFISERSNRNRSLENIMTFTALVCQKPTD
jgi:hypothetical protein